MSPLKGIAFTSSDDELAKLRERLRSMSDEELIKFWKMVRQLAEPRRVRLAAVCTSTGNHQGADIT